MRPDTGKHKALPTPAKKFHIDYHTTPVGTARMVFLSKPSDKFKAEGEYSTQLVLDGEEAAPLMKLIDKEVEASVEKAVRENPKLKKLIKAYTPYAADLDDDGEETGKYVFRFKRAAKQTLKDGTVKVNKVKLIDTDGVVVTDAVWAGSKIAVRFYMTSFFNATDKSAGISCKITHALVAELVSSGSNDGDEDTERLGFGKVEGFKVQKAAKPAAEEDDGAPDDGDDAGTADF